MVNPETIGSLCFLKTFHKKLKKNLNSGLVLTCLGGPKKKLSYKLSKNNYSSLDKLFKYLALKKECLIRPFDATTGSDERQYNSPGFNMKVGNICRTVYGDYPEYHTSGDNKKFMRIQKEKDAIDKLEKMDIEIDSSFLAFIPKDLISLSPDENNNFEKFIDFLEGLEDVQNVFSNHNFGES